MALKNLYEKSIKSHLIMHKLFYIFIINIMSYK